MKEKDLNIYDVWQSDNGNLFIKLTDEYSIAIGAEGQHAPTKWDLQQTQYIKANDVHEVKKVGRLAFDAIQLTKNDWDHMHDCVLVATWDGTPEGNLKRVHLNTDQLKALFNTLPDEMKLEAYQWGMNDTVWRENFIKYYTENCM